MEARGSQRTDFTLFSSDEIRYDDLMGMKWARSATKHGISEERSGYVIEHCGLYFKIQAPPHSPTGLNASRQLYLGDDADGVALEVIAIPVQTVELFVIHAMELREQFRTRYLEAKKWQTS